MIKLFKSFFVFFICAGVFTSCTIKPVVVKKVQDVKVKEYSMQGATVEVKLLVNNPNAMGFNIYKSNLNIKLNNIDLGEAAIVKKIRVKRKSETECIVLLRADFSKLDPITLIAAGKMLAGGKANPTVSVTGQLKVGKVFYKKSFPVDVKEKINLGR